jgi:hypothetical protein
MFDRIREGLDKGFFPPGDMLKRNLQAATAFLKVMAKHPYRFLKDVSSSWLLRIKAGKPVWAPLNEDRTNYITEEEIAKVTEEDIKRAIHKEKYLRPTRLCKPNAPEIVALAKKLGAWQKSDWEYAESIFNFMRKIKFEFGRLKSELEVLKSDKGVCLDQQSLGIALARAGGIPARYSITGFVFASPVEELLTVDPTFKEVYNALEVWEQHGAAEFYLDGKWIASDFTFPDETGVGLGLSIPQFGSNDIGLGVDAPETIARFEGFPWGYATLMKFGIALMRGMADRINARVEEITEKGRKLLEEKGVEAFMEKHKPTITMPGLPSLEEIEEFRKRNDLK